MADIVDRATRSRMMSGIRGKNTKPEIMIRKGLFERGFRYRLHVQSLPGRPDIVLRKYAAVILVNGCFWHGHGCHLFKWPTSNVRFWRDKINRNRTLDRVNRDRLESAGWRTLVIWECAFRGQRKKSIETIIDMTVKWLLSRKRKRDIR